MSDEWEWLSRPFLDTGYTVLEESVVNGVTHRRVRYADGLEVEISFMDEEPVEWAWPLRGLWP